VEFPDLDIHEILSRRSLVVPGGQTDGLAEVTKIIVAFCGFFLTNAEMRLVKWTGLMWLTLGISWRLLQT
jgi:hypothetical protein